MKGHSASLIVREVHQRLKKSQNGTVLQKDTCNPMFTATLRTTAKTRKQPKCPSTDDWIKEIWIQPSESQEAGKQHLGNRNQTPTQEVINQCPHWVSVPGCVARGRHGEVSEGTGTALFAVASFVEQEVGRCLEWGAHFRTPRGS
ncbi:LINE-1 retrotransposable element ORF2 protein [Camelus dromedarius]|uniref:LINE-1 retrotransposable element ORF2 protein n=1 Tax=Camelus dromedarius TaxID=9838 RepID=A0A5N4CRM1_CAMDR|nr:LINE-1 retrotransposable element ORF2 protein [Camelus dromedarius]